MFQSNTPAGPVDVRESKDVAEGLWLHIDPKSLEGLERVAEPRSGYPVFRVRATTYVLVFALAGRCMAMVGRRLPYPQRLMHALDWPKVTPFTLAP
jgi:hypothetical protein